MTYTLAPKKRGTTAISWATLLMAIACFGFLAWFVPRDRPTYRSTYASFNTDLPKSTQMVFSIPDIAFPAGAAAAVVLMIGVQWFTREKAMAAMFHMGMVMLCCVVFAAYREALFQPMAALIRTLSVGSP